MPFLTNNGHRLAYQTYGSGQPIVLLMGLGLPGVLWHDLVDRLLPEGFHVIIPDNLGTGRSEAPMPPYSMSEMADDVAAVMEHAGVDSAMVAGVSFGGMLAQHVTLQHPERVDGLLLAATTPGLPSGHFPRLKAIWLLLKMVFAGSQVTFDEAQRLLAHPSSRERLKRLTVRIDEVFEELPTPPWAIVGQLMAVLLHNTGPRLQEIRVPTRVVTGDSDFLIPPTNSEVLAEGIPSAVLSVVREAGHVFIHEHPDALMDNILALREAVGRRSAAA